MQPQLSVPMDNIYKFYAIFFLITCIACSILFFLVYESHKNTGISLVKELVKLEASHPLSEADLRTKELLEKELEVIQKNKTFYLKILSGVFGASLCPIFFGFLKWHFVIQPKHDILANLQIEKLKKEIASIETNSNRFRRKK